LHELISFISLAELASALKGERNSITRGWTSAITFFESAFLFYGGSKMVKQILRQEFSY